MHFTSSAATRATIASLVVAPLAAVVVPGVAASAALPPGAPRTGMVCTTGSLAGTTRTFDLTAETGHIDTPDGNSVFMWSYAETGNDFQSPGPVLCANEGETVVVNLTNRLPEPSSIVFPGQDAAVTPSGGAAGLLTREAPAAAGTANGTVSYTFAAGHPGTYVYESGSDPVKQLEMGLYGALVIRPAAGANTAYGPGTQFDPSREYLLLLADMDPDLHHAVEIGATYDYNAKRDRYFTINGRSFPDTIQDNGSGLLPAQPYGSLVRMQPNTAANNQPSLVRLLNVGTVGHPFHPHGNHTTQIAQDGRTDAPTEHFAETIAPGQTADFLLRWDDTDQWDPTTKPLPVAQPNYLDLTFKDGDTFYSGSPYLGRKGTLPTGTVSQNVCGEWYFPWHSHALNEFTNFDQGFGGMGTLLRIDPPGGCFAASGTTSIGNGALGSGSVSALAATDSSFYKVNAKTTTTSAAQALGAGTLGVASAAGLPAAGSFYVRVGNEVERVTAGQGTTTWTVARGQLGTTAAAHPSAATVTGLSTDWYAGFSGVPASPRNLRVTYAGRSCATSGTTCTAPPSPVSVSLQVCNWVTAPTGCVATKPAGWEPATATLTPSGTSDVTVTLTTTGAVPQYVGKSAAKGQVRVLVHSQAWSAPPTPGAFSTWGNSMQLTYDAP
jgi:hypothetical protein